jgi:Zn-dependent M28 family amino/carboxypeptidase
VARFFFHTAWLVGALACFGQFAAAQNIPFSGPKAFEYTREVVSFGQRTPGSTGHKRVEELILNRLKEDGAQIESDTFTVKTPRGPMPLRNIIGKFGSGSDHILIVSGHYDTKFLKGFVGANDGGSSTGLLLALADSLKNASLKAPVWLVFFDGEEAVGEWSSTDSTYGSRHLAEKFEREQLVPKIKAMILVDMIGDRDLDIVRDTSSTSWLVDFVESAASQTDDSQYFFKQSMEMDDDHRSFINAGIPSVDLIDFTFGPNNSNSWWHTPQDTMDKLSAHSFQVVGDVVLKTLQLLAVQ